MYNLNALFIILTLYFDIEKVQKSSWKYYGENSICRVKSAFKIQGWNDYNRREKRATNWSDFRKWDPKLSSLTNSITLILMVSVKCNFHAYFQRGLVLHHRSHNSDAQWPCRGGQMSSWYLLSSGICRPHSMWPRCVLSHRETGRADRQLYTWSFWPQVSWWGVI